MHKKLLLVWLTMGLVSCAGLNPNPGERTADTAWEGSRYDLAISIIMPAAERGEPWAQLRLGVAYELGVGVRQNTAEAIKWYTKVAIQKGESGWANGRLIFVFGKLGYFNQNSDALIAQYQMANLYLKGDSIGRDLLKAYLLAQNVSKESQGYHIFYCCEFEGGRYITARDISETLKNIENAMTDEERTTAKAKAVGWRPQDLKSDQP